MLAKVLKEESFVIIVNQYEAIFSLEIVEILNIGLNNSEQYCLRYRKTGQTSVFRVRQSSISNYIPVILPPTTADFCL